MLLLTLLNVQMLAAAQKENEELKQRIVVLEASSAGQGGGGTGTASDQHQNMEEQFEYRLASALEQLEKEAAHTREKMLEAQVSLCCALQLQQTSNDDAK